jgi:DNA primase
MCGESIVSNSNFIANFAYNPTLVMIDKATVSQILDAADIVDVVSDFVSLRRRGANFVGLCPFHNEKTPSFYVSRAKGICHCFSCGKGGSPVNFIMEHEQMTYYEALKYLANKYHIEVHERELSDEEREQQTERESMLIVNDYAMKYFEEQLTETQNGRDIGLAYFYERGFSDATIKKFHLGYCPLERGSLFKAAVAKGFNPKYLFSTGLCIEGEHGEGFDRYHGRVMFPVLSLAGKVIAFGGRTLSVKDHAKYVNSPESAIYVKRKELYGIYQAKQSIVKHDKCFLVEGYTDVISMHQSGIENVVASSGTSLTDGQIRMIHRFTNNVTVLYDGDAAGIKASLRGIDMLLAEGLNIKVLLLPDGDDPDSFARKHNATEYQQYIDEHETDFIKFKMRILLEGVQDDPIKRSAVIQDVVKSISVIPFPITRSVYVKECSRELDIDEKVLLNEIKKFILQNKQKEFEKREKEEAYAQAGVPSTETPPPPDVPAPEFPESKPEAPKNEANRVHNKVLFPEEQDVIRYVVKYGMAHLCALPKEDGTLINFNVVEFVNNELQIDKIDFSTPVFSKIFTISLSYLPDFYTEFASFTAHLQDEMQSIQNKMLEESQANLKSIADIEKNESQVKAEVEKIRTSRIDDFRCLFIEKRLCSHPDDDVRQTALNLVSEKYQLSKIHTKYATIRTEYDRRFDLITEAIYNWKSSIILCKIKDIRKKISEASAAGNTDEAEEMIKTLQNLYSLRANLAKVTGERVVNPII